MTVSPYLFFNGNCAEAMRFYERALGGRLDALMKYSESPEGCPENARPDQIMHAHLTFRGGILMASDDMTGGHKGMGGFAVSIDYPTAEEAKRAYDALAEGGKVWAPWAKTFWSEGFGMFADRFGTPWMVSVTSKEDVDR
jgi:PhnB protein